ncbi:MAG: hypothetical protein LBQ82_00395 [Treponema sp.]|nr:hypothetical protein [Treponema sp.]
MFLTLNSCHIVPVYRLNEKTGRAGRVSRIRDIIPIINEMFSKEFLELFMQLIKSWQVLVVTVGLVIYVYLVSYVARSYHRPRVKKVKKTKAKKAEPVQEAGPEETEASGNSNDELGLEEA